MRRKHTGLVAGVAVLAALAAGAPSGSARWCPDGQCQQAPPADKSLKTSAAKPKVVPQRSADRQGSEAWRSGSWLME